MARRTSLLQIRLTDEELAVIERLAASEHLPVSTYARRLLLKDAIDKGLYDESATDDAPSNDTQKRNWLFGNK